ncbi:unnamed protein product [Brassicogethes aeneus]|uniref:Inosine/uridine-preferring nucleoside hydrolase domain-containing protein n=1 Tax=Brassicogethes aeneus TaxID=1431903 RepID=A0A9P0FL07_BRAAE|nr:unnamed protein product [Brassicogethes aeneus]
MNVKRVIIDCDVGTDDFVALLILFYAEKLRQVKIEAITLSAGNTTLENVSKNLIRLLELIGRTDVPIFKGSEKPLILQKGKVKLFHGNDGFGDLSHENEPDISIVNSTHSSVALGDIINKNPGEISLIFVGPLTNLALAIKLDTKITENVKDLWIMGGNYTGVGNYTATSEFNFYFDPEAVQIVLECMKCPINILPWEACLVPHIPFDWRYNNLGVTSPSFKLLTRAERAVYHVDEKNWLPCDAFVAFVFLNPEDYIVKKTPHHAVMELHGHHTRGQLVLDHLKENKPNVHIIEQFDDAKFKELLLEIELVF